MRYTYGYSDWSIRWWQWISPIPRQSNPAFDLTGEFVYNSQNIDDVTFLCQRIEGRGNIPRRKSNLPYGNYFFMPIINWISIYGIDGIDDRELIAIAKEKMNVIDTLELRINGFYLTSELMKNRVLSTFFDIDLPENNIFGLDEGRRRCISDGYWIFFQSSSDRLIVSSNSSCSSGITKIGAEYHLSKV